MWLAVLFVWSSLLPLAASEGCLEASEDASSWVRLKPLGHCRDGENTCPYRITLPPLTIQLPRPFRELEKMARELKSLTQVVNQLKADCRECKERQRVECSLRRTSDGEEKESIQASRAAVNTKERHQDLPKKVQVVQGATEEEDTMLFRRGTKQVDPTDMEKEQWNTSQERSLHPSRTRDRVETSGRPRESDHTHMERGTDSMSKVREPHTISSEERAEELQSPKAKQIESYLPGHQDVKQPTQAYRDIGNGRESQQDLLMRVKGFQGTTQNTEEDAMLISSGTKQVNPTDMEKERWRTFQERNSNPDSTRYREETSERPKESTPAHMERITDSTSKVRETHIFSTGETGKDPLSSKTKLTESYLLGHRDEERPKQSSSGPVNSGVSKKVIVAQGTIQKTEEEEKKEEEEEEEDTVLFSSSTKQVNPTGMEKQRSDTSQDGELIPSSTRHGDETSREPKGSHPTHVEKRKEIMSKERNSNPDSTTYRGETSGGPTESTPAHMERGTDSTSKVREPPTFSAGEESRFSKPKLTESHLAGHGDEERPKQASSGPVNTSKRHQEETKKVQGTVQKPEEEEKEGGGTILISSSTKQVNPTGTEKQRSDTSQDRGLNPSSTRHGDEMSGGPKGSNTTHIEKRKEMSKERNSNPDSTTYRGETSGGPTESTPAHMERGTDSTSKVREPPTFSAGEESRFSKTKLTESHLPGHGDEEWPKQASSGPVNTSKRHQEETKKVQGTVQKPGEEEKEGGGTILISSSTKQVNPTGTEKQRSDTSQDRGLNPSSTRHGDEMSGEPKGSNTTHIEKRKEMSKVRELLSNTAKERQKELQSPRAKQTESSGPGNQHPTQAPDTRVREQDVPRRVMVVQGTIQKPGEGNTVLIYSDNSDIKELNSTATEKERWNTTKVRNPNPSITRNRDETSGRPKGANPAHNERRTDIISKVRESHSHTAKEKGKELQLPRAKQIESSLPGNQEEEESRHTGAHKASTAKTGQGQNASGIVIAQGDIKSTPETSVVKTVSEDSHVKINPPNKDKPIRRFPGFPRLINTNRKETKLNPNAEDRFKTSGDKTKVYSPAGERAGKTVSRGSGFTPIRTRPSEETLHKADSRDGTGSGWSTPDPYTEDQDATLPDFIRNASKIMVRKKVVDERQPASSAKAQNITEMTKTILDQQREIKEDVGGTGVNKSRTFTVVDTGDSVVPKEGRANMAPHPSSENKGKKEKKENSNTGASHIDPKKAQMLSKQGTDAERDTEMDANPTETVSGSKTSSPSVTDTSDSTIATGTQTWDSHSESPFSPGRKDESDTEMNSNPVTPVRIIGRPEKISSVSDHATTDVGHSNPEIWDRTSENRSTHAEADTEMDSVSLNTVKTVTGFEKSIIPISSKAGAAVDVSQTDPRGLDNTEDLPKGQIKPDLNTTQPSSEEYRGSNPVSLDTERKKWISNATLRTDRLKQTLTAGEDESPVRGVKRPGMPAVGQKVRGRPRFSGATPLTSKEMRPDLVNSTKGKEGAREVLHPSLRIGKNVTRIIPNPVNQPDRPAPITGILAKDPKSRRPYILQRMTANRSVETASKPHGSERARNTSGLPERAVELGSRHVSSKTGSSTTRPETEFRSSADEMTQSVRATAAVRTATDRASAEKDKIAPTVEALNSLDNHQTQNTPRNTETKLFHVTEPESPGGKRGLDPITDGVREHSVETVMNQSIRSHDSNSGPDSHQAVVEKTKSADKKKGTKPFMGSSVDSVQENSKILLRTGDAQNSRGGILPNAAEEGQVSAERNELNYSTTAATAYTIKTVIRNKQSQMTQLATPGVTTPHFTAQDHEEKAKGTSGAKVSNTNVRSRVNDSSQEMESQTLTGTRAGSDSRNKEQDPVLQGTRKAGGTSKVGVSHPSSVDSVPNRAKESSPGVVVRVQSTAGPPLTDSTPPPDHENSNIPVINGASKEGNNGESYPVAVDRTGDAINMREEISYTVTAESTSEENSTMPPIVNNVEDREGFENQLLSTCHGQCDPGPTPQPTLHIQRSSERDREKQPRDCSDLMEKNPKSGVYSVTRAGSKSSTFHVSCDMEASGGSWTLIQRRFDGSLSFNRTWNDYKRGFGNLTGEFWLGNDKIHWLTSAKAMVLRIELEDLDGVKEHAQYDLFHVANESQHYRLTIGGYSGTAGDAMTFNKRFNHDQKNFTTPDRDNDQYPSGNCGAYYSSGWWFDACMAANLNGKYYQTRYRGVRNGIFWGTWHNISTEYYPTNDRQSFKTVRMMVRPRTGPVRDY